MTLDIRKAIHIPCRDINGYSWQLTQEHNRASPFVAEIITKPGIIKVFMAHTPRNRITKWVTKKTAELKLTALLMPKPVKTMSDWEALVVAMNKSGRRGTIVVDNLTMLSDDLLPNGLTGHINIPASNQAAAFAKITGKRKSKYGSPYGP